MFVIVNYGVGNLTSIQNMLKKAGVKAIISSNQAEIEQADKILLPGMGAFDNCMIKLNQSGLRPSIEHKAHVEKIPFLGICVGLQMLMASSEEGVEKGLGWIDGKTIKFKSERMQEHQKIPNMGWLEIEVMKPSALMEELKGSRFYFAHSYHVRVNAPDDELISAHYGYDFTAGVERGNILGVQFHPEKSHRFGLQLFKNFAENY